MSRNPGELELVASVCVQKAQSLLAKTDSEALRRSLELGAHNLLSSGIQLMSRVRKEGHIELKMTT